MIDCSGIWAHNLPTVANCRLIIQSLEREINRAVHSLCNNEYYLIARVLDII